MSDTAQNPICTRSRIQFDTSRLSDSVREIVSTLIRPAVPNKREVIEKEVDANKKRKIRPLSTTIPTTPTRKTMLCTPYIVMGPTLRARSSDFCFDSEAPAEEGPSTTTTGALAFLDSSSRLFASPIGGITLALRGPGAHFKSLTLHAEGAPALSRTTTSSSHKKHQEKEKTEQTKQIVRGTLFTSSSGEHLSAGRMRKMRLRQRRR